MNNEVSYSKTPPPQPPLTTSMHATRLAPGFRFHPTDEELVSYYLKRKVTGRPIRVDAISEVDLYKIEPWDLPPHSRLHSRDLEWYFFTGLDRKYSNRSRTNRATTEGYWKTTGKDRPVRRHSQIVGMKKTLVYHAGRAPRGQRTNWVMHEYRLEGEDVSYTGIQQDGCVLCRVFQKSGPGPQNGAQYGAPYEEEEWERYDEEDANLALGNDEFIGPSNEDFVHVSDFLQNQDAAIHPHLDAFPLVAKSNEQDIDNNAEGSSFSVEDVLKDYPCVEDHTTGMNNGFREKPIVKDELNAAAASNIQNNGYVQLEDIVCGDNTCFTSSNGGYSNDRLSGRHDHDISGIGPPDPVQTHHPTQHDDTHHLEPPSLYDSAQPAVDNLMLRDSLGLDSVQYLDGFTINEAPISAEYDFLEELMAFYDATDDTLHHSTRTNSFLAECSEAVRVPKDVAECAFSRKASSSNNIITLGVPSENLLADIEEKDPHGKTLMNRLASMLESISAPPAFAAEPTIIGKMSGKISGGASTSSLHVTAGMIQIQNTIAMGCSENWSLSKYGESASASASAFLFSYGIDNRVISKSVLHEQRKAHCGFFTLIFRCSFYSLLLSALMLALSYRVGFYVYNL